jgi:hypothetical protein
MWEGYVVPGSDPEQSELRSCLAAANSLVERDVAGLPVSYRVASMLVTEALGSLGAARGDYLADGVVVSSFLPMRAIPFRHTFVLGLGEGAFPARDTRDTMDLRLERRRLGDVRASERDKYMFLEVLLSARDALSISWVARDPYTGDEIQPSPVVGLLVDNLRRSYLSAEEGAVLIETHALFRHEPLDPRSPFAEAHVEAWLRHLGRLARASLRGRDAAQGDPGDRPPELARAIAALHGTLPEEDLARLQRELRTISLTEGWRADGTADTASAGAAPAGERDGGGITGRTKTTSPLETLYLSRAHLARFLEDPQSGWAEALLGVTRADDEEAEESLEDEPFEPSGLTKVVALRQAFWEGSAPGSTLPGAYERTVARLQARGEWPVASLASARREPDLALLDEWRAGLASLALPGERPQRVRLGDALEDGDVERLMPSLALTLADPRPGHRTRLRVMLRGRTEALLEHPGQRASLLLEPVARPSVARARARREERSGLRGFLDHLLLSASGEEAERHVVQVLYPGEPRPIAVALAGLSSEAAREYLSALVTDLLTGPHAYYAPPTPLLEALPEWGTRSAEAWQAALARTRQEAFGRSYGSVPHAEEYPLPSVAELHAMYTRRYGLYVQLRGGGGRMSVLRRFARPDVLDEIPLASHAWIEASAGTGKTFTLEHLIVDLIVRAGARLDEILVLTFTEKATLEMRERVRDTLVALVHAGPTDPRVDPLDPSGTANVWSLDEAALARLSEAVAGFEAASIHTIHGYCQRVLKEHAFRSRGLFEQVLTDTRSHFRRAVRAVLREALRPGDPAHAVLRAALQGQTPSQLTSTLEQWASEPGLLMPPASLEQVHAAAAACVPSSRLHALLAAAREDGARTKGPLAEHLEALHACAVQVLGTGDLMDAAAQIASWSSRPQGSKPAPQWIMERAEKNPALLRALAPFEALLGSVPHFPMLVVQTLLPRVLAKAQAGKQARGEMDFDDLLTRVRDAVAGEAGEPLVAALRAQHRFAIVDEFQDTDATQWEIFRRLFFDGNERPAEVPLARRRALYLIGDPKQAIYAFRGADVHTYLKARESLAPYSRRVVLTQNFRSTPGVIGAYNAIFARGFFTGPIRYDAPVTCGNPSLTAEHLDGRPALPLVLLRPVDASADKLSADGARDLLAGAIAEEIARLLGESDAALAVGPEGALRCLEPSDIYVLGRNGKDLDGVHDRLAARGIPCGVLQAARGSSPRARPRTCSWCCAPWRTRASAATASRPGSRRSSGCSSRSCAATSPCTTTTRWWRAWCGCASAARCATTRASRVSCCTRAALARRELFVEESARRLTNYQHLVDILLTSAHGRRRTVDELVVDFQALVQGQGRSRGGRRHRAGRRRTGSAGCSCSPCTSPKGLEAEVVFVLGGLGSSERPGSEPRGEARTRDARGTGCAPLPAAVAADVTREQSRGGRAPVLRGTDARALTLVPAVLPAAMRLPVRATRCARALPTTECRRRSAGWWGPCPARARRGSSCATSSLALARQPPTRCAPRSWESWPQRRPGARCPRHRRRSTRSSSRSCGGVIVGHRPLRTRASRGGARGRSRRVPPTRSPRPTCTMPPRSLGRPPHVKSRKQGRGASSSAPGSLCRVAPPRASSCTRRSSAWTCTTWPP